MQVQVCIHLCCILAPILLSSLLRLFNVAGLIWKLLHTIPYSLNRGHHGLTRSVQNLDSHCTQHQLIQWGSRSLNYSLRFSWKLFFGASGLRLASSLLILYLELVIWQGILFRRNTEIAIFCYMLYTSTVFLNLRSIVSRLTSLEHYLVASLLVFYYVRCGPSLLYPFTFWLVPFRRHIMFISFNNILW